MATVGEDTKETNIGVARPRAREGRGITKRGQELPRRPMRGEGAMEERLTHAELCHFLDTRVPFIKSLGISCEEF